MESKLVKIFKNAKYESNPDLAFSILTTLTAQNKRATKIKLWFLAFVGFASLGGLVPALQMLLNDLSRSGFYEYFSLIFSDGGSMLSYWKDLVFSLAESLPIMSIASTLFLFFISFLSLKYLMKQIQKNQSLSFSKLSLSI